VSDVKMRVGARLRDGTTKHYDVLNISDPAEARAFVLENVPSARVVLAVVPGGRANPVPPTVKAAA
jgi:hypothetical protein